MIGVGIYSLTIDFPPVWDDHDFFEQNEQIRSLSSIPEYFYRQPETTHGGVFRPVVYVYHTILFWADAGRPRGLRLFFIICNVLASLTLVGVIRLALRQLEGETTARLHAGIPELAGVLFLVHPVHVEAVTWLSGGGYTVSGLFFLLAFLAFQRSKLWLSLLAYTLGILTTEMALSLPILMVLYALLRRRPSEGPLATVERRFFSGAVVHIAAIVLVTVLYLVYRHAILGQLTRGIPPYGGSVFVTAISMGKVLLDYLQLLLVPGNLLVDHHFAILGKGQIWYVAIVAEILVFLVLVFTLVRKRDPVSFFFLMWFFVTLLPVSNLIPSGGTPKAERYLFLPSAGIVSVMVLLLGHLTGLRIHLLHSGRLFPMKPFIVQFLVFLVAAFGARTVLQNRVWESDHRLWYQTLTQNLFNPRAQGNYCASLWETGDFVDILSCYRRAHRFTGGFQAEMASVFLALGRKGEAEKQLREALSMNPEHDDAKKMLGMTLISKGDIKEAYEYLNGYNGKNRDPNFLMAIATAALVNEEEDKYQILVKELVTTYPEYEEYAKYLLGYHFDTLGKDDDAIREWHQYIVQYDTSYVNLTGLAVSLSKAGRDREAKDAFDALTKKYPAIWMAYYNAGLFHIRKGRFMEAIPILEKGLEVDPASTDLLNNLAYCYLRIGDLTRAKMRFQRLAQEAPNYYPAHGNIGRAYQWQRQYGPARTFLEKFHFLNEKDPRTFAYLGDLYNEMGYAKLAHHYYLTAVDRILERPELLEIVVSDTEIENDRGAESALRMFKGKSRFE